MTIIALIAAISMGNIKMDLRRTPSTEKPQQPVSAEGAVEETAVVEDENVIENDEKKDLEQGQGS